jgi:archaemetzincin
MLPSGTPAGTRVLGLTTSDISVTKDEHPDWGVFGYGEMPGDAAVVSSYRLKPKDGSVARMRTRVVRVAVHEIGHTFGLDHCTETGCVMLDAEGSVKNTDTSTGDLGPDCRAKLDASAPVVVAP